ncbi:MAG: hypothetical protein RIS94_2698, partial [Pseudomonadota bacterium]
MQGGTKASGPRDTFVSLSPENYTVFPAVLQIVRRRGKAALDRLYHLIASHPGASRMLPTSELRVKAAGAQLNHWDRLFSGRFDADAIARSEKVGRVHADIGLSASYYIGGYAVVLEEMIERSVAAHPVGRLFGRKLGRTIATLVKTGLLDMEAALSAYFKAEEEGRSEVIARMGKAMAAMATGDLRMGLEDVPTVYQQIARDFHGMRHEISNMIVHMTEAAEHINLGAGEISAAADDQAHRTERQAAALARASEMMRHVASAVETTADSARQVDSTVADVDERARHSGEIVK